MAKGLKSIRESRDAYADRFQKKKHEVWGHEVAPLDALKPLLLVRLLSLEIVREECRETSCYKLPET